MHDHAPCGDVCGLRGVIEFHSQLSRKPQKEARRKQRHEDERPCDPLGHERRQHAEASEEEERGRAEDEHVERGILLDVEYVQASAIALIPAGFSTSAVTTEASSIAGSGRPVFELLSSSPRSSAPTPPQY